MENDRKLTITPAPHLHGPASITRDMYIVVLALLFPTAGAVYFFGAYVILMLVTAIATAILAEYVAKWMRRRPFRMDGSAVVTAILFVLVMPPRTPLWVVIVGTAFSIWIAKEAFGGLGHNVFNPALAGRAFATVSFAGALTNWIAPVHSFLADGVTTATPLSESFTTNLSRWAMYKALFIGNVAGSTGETSAMLILIGGLILIAFGLIRWQVPFFYIGTVALLSWALGEDPLFQILAGGLFLGAFFMATDPVSSPLTKAGRWTYGIIIGVATALIRNLTGYVEGMMFAILLGNVFAPILDEIFVAVRVRRLREEG